VNYPDDPITIERLLELIREAKVLLKGPSPEALAAAVAADPTLRERLLRAEAATETLETGLASMVARGLGKLRLRDWN
jgi:hypothetical protein